MTDQTSELLYMRAKLRLPGGVNSPVRAYQAVGRTPRFIQSAKGSHITDVDGNEMIDYVCSWGPGILGHADPRVIEKVKAACEEGLTFGAPDRAGSGDGRTSGTAGAIHGSQPSGKLRNRGNDECHPCCAGIYEA